MKIDYKSEVKRVYPDAHMSCISDLIFMIWTDDSDSHIGLSSISEWKAWEDAYYELVSQNKLTHKNEEV